MTHIEGILLQTATFVFAGGRGARLAPLTHKRSKPAVPFGDRRIIDFALANCLRSNLKHPSVITQYQRAHLMQHVGRWWLEQSASGADATASPVCVPCPSQQYLATADALFRNVQRLDPETRSPRFWKDVGTIDSYYEASMIWLNTLPENHRLSGSRSVISEGVRIDRTAEVIDSILVQGIVIGPGARVRRAILDENVRVQAGVRLGYETSESQGFARTPNGVVVVPANSIIPAASSIYAAPRKPQIQLEPQLAP